MYGLLPFLFFGITIVAVAATDPLAGEWVANATRAGQRFAGMRTETLRIDVEGVRITILEAGTGRDGGKYSLKFSADCDGKVNGILGNPDIDSVQCWRSDSRTLVLKLIREASAREWRTAELAKNGQTLRITSTVEDANGKEDKAVAVLARK